MSLPATGYELLALDPEYTGSCPCATFTYDGHRYDAHCWRVCSKCRGCGLHYFNGTKEEAERLARLLTEMDWYGEWSVRQGPLR